MGWVVNTSLPIHPPPPGKGPVRAVKEGGRALGTVWTDAKISPLPGFDRPSSPQQSAIPTAPVRPTDVRDVWQFENLGHLRVMISPELRCVCHQGFRS